MNKLVSFGSLLLGLQKIVNKRVKKDSKDSNTGSNLLFVSEGLSSDSSHVNHHDDTFGSVGYGSGHCTCHFQCVGSKLIVNVEAETRHDEVKLKTGVSFQLLKKCREHASLGGKHDRKEDNKADNLGDGKLRRIQEMKGSIEFSKNFAL